MATTRTRSTAEEPIPRPCDMATKNRTRLSTSTKSMKYQATGEYGGAVPFIFASTNAQTE